ncbi:MAG: GMC family oxidoreductase N-terminal domain-containing protein [Thermodesulfobacteriota bacterium]
MIGKLHLQADVIVVGSGPGGATVARELSRSGKKVLVLERGYDHRDKFYYGTYLGALKYSERMALLYTEEGLNIIAPIMVGGATNLFTACSAFPPSWFKTCYGVDIEQEAQETIRELDIKPLPEHLRGAASTRIAAAARAIGYDWFPQPKFMNPEQCSHGDKSFSCTAKCMLGCRCGAKWTAAEWIDEAIENGADLRTSARVKQVRIEGSHVAGVEGWIGPRKFIARAGTVVLAAGGIGTPRILQKSGFLQAGIGMTMDTTVMVYGRSKWIGNGNDPPMTWSFENEDAGYMLSTLTDPFLLYPMAAVQKGLGPALLWLRWHRLLGIMIKLKDDISGGIYPDGKIRKPLTAGDSERLNNAYDVCRRILEEAGADASSIFMRPFIGTHPSGTVRIGEMLNSDLQTEIDGLYVCDASVFPESLDRPTVLTIISLAKRLAKYLAQAG